MEKILLIPILISIFYFSFSGLGNLSLRYSSKKSLINVDLYPLIAMPIIFSLITYLHLFYKLNPLLNLLIILIGLIGYIFNFKKIKNIKIFSILLFILTIQFLGHEVNEDFGYYHLPYIINFISDKIILGLGHLSMVQGYNSAWLNLNSLFFLPYFFDKSVHFLNSVIIFSASIFYLKFLLNKKNYLNYPLSTFYAVFLLFFFIVKNSRLNSFGVDVPGHIFATLVLFLFFNFCENGNYYFRKIYFNLILIFSIFSILIKLSYVPLILIPLICLIIEKKILDKKIILLSFLLAIPWVIQQIGYTSCIIFPVEITCFKSLPWYSKNFINDAAFSLEYINKSYWVYEGTLNEEEYINDFNWVSTWFLRNFIEISENLLTFSIPLIFFYFLSNKQNRHYKLNKTIWYVLIPISIGFFIWFLKAPVVRYGIFYLNSFLFFIIIFFLKKNLLNLNKKFIIITLIFGLTFNLVKNINRIINLNNYVEFPFPKIEKIVYETKTQDNIKFNTPIVQESNQSSVCWNVPIYCRPGKFDHLIIYKKKGYIIFVDKINLNNN